MFDNNKHCLLTDGDYELALNEKNKRPGRKKGILSNRTSWENVFEGQVSKQRLVVMFNCTRTLLKTISLACLEIRHDSFVYNESLQHPTSLIACPSKILLLWTTEIFTCSKVINAFKR